MSPIAIPQNCLNENGLLNAEFKVQYCAGTCHRFNQLQFSYRHSESFKRWTIISYVRAWVLDGMSTMKNGPLVGRQVVKRVFALRLKS